MSLEELIATARQRGLRQMRVHLVGTTDPQWQVTSRFAQSSGFHVAIENDLSLAIERALNPPTGQTPLGDEPHIKTYGTQKAIVTNTNIGLFD